MPQAKKGDGGASESYMMYVAASAAEPDAGMGHSVPVSSLRSSPLQDE